MMTLQGQCNSIRRKRWSPKRSQRLPVCLCVGCSGMSRHKPPGQLAALRGHQIHSDFAADLLNLAVKSGILIISYLLESVWSNSARSVHAGPSRGIVYTLSSVLWKKFCLMSPALMKMKCRTQTYCTNDKYYLQYQCLRMSRIWNPPLCGLSQWNYVNLVPRSGL